MDIVAVIEDPRGSTIRHHWDPVSEQWVARAHPHSAEPWPASYGYIPGTWNSADNGELDVLVLAETPLETGDSVRVRPVGLLQRPDGDDKVLAVMIDDPRYGSVTRLDEVPRGEIDAIVAWFANWSEVGSWQNECGAIDRISASRLE